MHCGVAMEQVKSPETNVSKSKKSWIDYIHLSKNGSAATLLVAGFCFLFAEYIPFLAAMKPIFGATSALSAISLVYVTSRIEKLSQPSLTDKEKTAVPTEEAAAQMPKEAAIDNPKAGTVILGFTDKATGLGNKMRFVEKFKTVSAKCDLAISDNDTQFAVGIVNLDGMKPINDLFGFEGGDRLIQQCSMRLRAAVEEFGFVFRYGGDEFAFILPNAGSPENVLRLGKLLQDVLLAPFDIDGSSVRLSGSFGFALYPDAGDDFDKVIASIETALYHSKRKGRGRLTLYSSEIENTVRENAILEQALRGAIADNNISPHYQPIISLQDGSLLGFEALARWIDPELGFVSPAKFIPLAEERGIIAPLTEVLLLQAAKTAADWPDDLFLSFNLSSTQLVDPTTAEAILETIRRAGLSPNRLEIEVTETAMMSDPEIAAKIIEELHDAGVRISMDDFGTGQSSLGRLRELKLDKVKIDRAFIMAIGEDKPAEHIVRAILEMCAGLNLTVVAEGIEEINQAESLKQFGCHAGQGYLFGKPQNATKTMGYIREFSRIAKSDREAKVA